MGANISCIWTAKREKITDKDLEEQIEGPSPIRRKVLLVLEKLEQDLKDIDIYVSQARLKLYELLCDIERDYPPTRNRRGKRRTPEADKFMNSARFEWKRDSKIFRVQCDYIRRVCKWIWLAPKSKRPADYKLVLCKTGQDFDTHGQQLKRQPDSLHGRFAQIAFQFRAGYDVDPFVYIEQRESGRKICDAIREKFVGFIADVDVACELVSELIQVERDMVGDSWMKLDK